jgi:hypothetical protein
MFIRICNKIVELVATVVQDVQPEVSSQLPERRSSANGDGEVPIRIETEHIETERTGLLSSIIQSHCTPKQYRFRTCNKRCYYAVWNEKPASMRTAIYDVSPTHKLLKESRGRTQAAIWCKNIMLFFVEHRSYTRVDSYKQTVEWIHPRSQANDFCFVPSQKNFALRSSLHKLNHYALNWYIACNVRSAEPKHNTSTGIPLGFVLVLSGLLDRQVVTFLCHSPTEDYIYWSCTDDRIVDVSKCY